MENEGIACGDKNKHPQSGYNNFQLSIVNFSLLQNIVDKKGVLGYIL